MSGWRPLARLLVGHDFFHRDPCPAVEVRLQPHSRALLQRMGLVVRHEAGGAAVLHSGDLEALASWAAELGEGLRLDFRVEPRDPRFRDYTAPGPVPPGRILAFDSREGSPPREDEPVRLSRRERVSEEDLVDTDSERLAPVLTSRDRRLPPVAVVSIHLADARGRLLVPDPGDEGTIWRVDFQARQTYWRYLFLGALARDGASVTDSDRETEFEPHGETRLPGDRRALAFRSTTPIPLRERSDRRFQLRLDGSSGSSSNGNGRVLVKRLPVASPEGLRRETIDGSPALVSDIFVNG